MSNLQEVTTLRDEEAKAIIYEAPHVWRIGDLISVGRSSERRLIISLSEQHMEVIAESGWYNRYQIPSVLPIIFHCNTGLVYAHKGRETLYADFLKGTFTTYFTYPQT